MGNRWLNLAAASQLTTAGGALTSIRDGFFRIGEALFKLMGTVTESFAVGADHFLSGQHHIIPAFSAHFTAVLQFCLDFGAQNDFF